MKNDSKIYATIVTMIALILLFLLLWYVYLDRPFVPEEEGIEVAFGDATEGGGLVEPIPAPVPSPEPSPATAPSQPAAPSSNDLMTQEDEEALALQREQEKKRREQEQAEALERERQKKEQEALEAKKREEDRLRAEAERAAAKAAEEQAKKDKAAQLGSLFGNPSAGTGSAGTQGNTKKGNPAAGGQGVGSGTSGGHGWSLTGRSLKGALADPVYKSNAEGVVVVAIRVNAAGKVVSATKGQGTNTSDHALIDAACEAAKQATFSAGDGDVLGTITYVFKLK